MYRGFLKLFTIILILFTSVTTLHAATLPTELLFINDELIQLPEPIKLHQNTYYVPLRACSEYLGFQVAFNKNTQVITLSRDTTSYTYNIQADSNLFIQNNITYINADTFFPMLGFNINYDSSLFISHYTGDELLDLSYLSQPIPIATYEEIPVTSLLVNQMQPGILYSEGEFSSLILTSSYSKGQIFLTFTPYTLIDVPKGYSTLDMPFIINYNYQYFTFPITASNYGLLFNTPQYATLQIDNAIITDVTPIYMP